MFGLGTQKINNVTVKPIPVPTVDETKIKGYKLFAEPYSNVFLCAKKKSGKTNVIFKILKDCAGPDTKIIIFASTVNKDSNYLAIKKYFEEKEIEISTFTHYNEEGVNVLDDLIKVLQQKTRRRRKEAKEEAN